MLLSKRNINVSKRLVLLLTPNIFCTQTCLSRVTIWEKIQNETKNRRTCKRKILALSISEWVPWVTDHLSVRPSKTSRQKGHVWLYMPHVGYRYTYVFVVADTPIGAFLWHPTSSLHEVISASGNKAKRTGNQKGFLRSNGCSGRVEDGWNQWTSST